MQKPVDINAQASWHWLKDSAGNWSKWRTLRASEVVIVVVDRVGIPFEFAQAVKTNRLLPDVAAATEEGAKVEWLESLNTFGVKESGK